MMMMMIHQVKKSYYSSESELQVLCMMKSIKSRSMRLPLNDDDSASNGGNSNPNSGFFADDSDDDDSTSTDSGPTNLHRTD